MGSYSTAKMCLLTSNDISKVTWSSQDSLLAIWRGVHVVHDLPPSGSIVKLEDMAGAVCVFMLFEKILVRAQIQNALGVLLFYFSRYDANTCCERIKALRTKNGIDVQHAGR